MALKKAKLEELALKAINDHDLVFITEIVAYLPCNRSTFYSKGLDKSDTIKEALENKRIEVKSDLRSQWRRSENATTQIALYKLLGTEDEAHRLNGSKQEIDQNINLPEKLEEAILKGLEKAYGD